MSDATTAIRTALEDLSGLPGPVSAWNVTEGLDATDGQAVWILAIVDADHLSPKTFHDIKTIVRTTVRTVTSDLWPYVTVRTADEQDRVGG